jgi:hypothetical protein
VHPLPGITAKFGAHAQLNAQTNKSNKSKRRRHTLPITATAISKFLVILFINLQGVMVLVSVQSHEWTAAE